MISALDDRVIDTLLSSRNNTKKTLQRREEFSVLRFRGLLCWLVCMRRSRLSLPLRLLLRRSLKDRLRSLFIYERLCWRKRCGVRSLRALSNRIPRGIGGRESLKGRRRSCREVRRKTVEVLKFGRSFDSKVIRRRFAGRVRCEEAGAGVSPSYRETLSLYARVSSLGARLVVSVSHTLTATGDAVVFPPEPSLGFRSVEGEEREAEIELLTALAFSLLRLSVEGKLIRDFAASTVPGELLRKRM
jgi:hypothetical protein